MSRAAPATKKKKVMNEINLIRSARCADIKLDERFKRNPDANGRAEDMKVRGFPGQE